MRTKTNHLQRIRNYTSQFSLFFSREFTIMPISTLVTNKRDAKKTKLVNLLVTSIRSCPESEQNDFQQILHKIVAFQDQPISCLDEMVCQTLNLMFYMYLYFVSAVYIAFKRSNGDLKCRFRILCPLSSQAFYVRLYIHTA